MKKIISFAMAGIMSVCMLTGCGPKYEKFSDMLLTQQYFNTVITIISYQPSQEDFDEMVDEDEINIAHLAVKELLDYND